MIFQKKAQAGILGFIFAYITVFLVWVFWAHEQITYWTQQAILNGSITGVKAFFLANMNLWILLGFILGLALLIYAGSNQ